MNDNTTNTNTQQVIEQDLYHFLAGAFKANSARIEVVLSYPHWQKRAQEELDRRLSRMIETFSDETLQALAEGNVNLRDVAAKAARGEAPGG